MTFTVTYEKLELELEGHLLSFVVSYHLFVFFNNANTVSRKCEYGVLEITSDTKVSSHESKTSDLTRLLYHA